MGITFSFVIVQLEYRRWNFWRINNRREHGLEGAAAAKYRDWECTGDARQIAMATFSIVTGGYYVFSSQW
jgi:hypothetical protein